MKNYSGRFVIRIPEGLHKILVERADSQNSSLNKLCQILIEKGLREKEEAPWRKEVSPLLLLLKQKFGSQLTGILLFGSQIQGNATQQSDLDVLVVLAEEIPLKRNLYQWWDSTFFQKSLTINPHFVHLPQDISQVGGLWFEVALSHEIIYEKRNNLSSIIKKLLSCIQKGEVARAFSNGHPYWVRREDAK